MSDTIVVVEVPVSQIISVAEQGPIGQTGDTGPAGTTDFTQLQNVPATFPPSAHTHPLAQVTDAGTAASRNVPAAGDAASGEVVLGSDSRLTNARAPTSHAHPISDITGLQAALDNVSAVITSPTQPVSPAINTLWVRTSDFQVFLYYDNGITTSWVAVQAVAGVHYGATPPTPAEYRLWFDTENLVMMTYYNDGTSSQWVDITTGNVASVDHGTQSGLLDDDHPQYTISSGPTRADIELPASPTAGHVLTVRDGKLKPEAPAAGGWTTVSTTTISVPATNFVFANLTPGHYQLIADTDCASVANSTVKMDASDDNGATFVTTVSNKNAYIGIDPLLGNTQSFSQAAADGADIGKANGATSSVGVNMVVDFYVLPTMVSGTAKTWAKSASSPNARGATFYVFSLGLSNSNAVQVRFTTQQTGGTFVLKREV